MRYSYLLSFLIYAAFNCALVLMSAAVVCYYAPASAGSGIPEIKGYLNGIDMPGECRRVLEACPNMPVVPRNLP